MKKRIVPALLALVLTLSLMPVAFATPMTFVLQTIGDTDKEFVYYIESDMVDRNLAGGNVKKIETRINICNCGFIVMGTQENPTTIWRNHTRLCERNYITDYTSFYKITLKNEESVKLNTAGAYLTIYFEQPGDYSLSYSIDGNNFTYYKNDENIILSETGMGKITISSRDSYFQAKTIILRRSDGSAPDYTPTGSGTSFPDVPQNADYFTAVEYVNKLGIMVGDEKGNFNPDKIVSRAEMATIVCRMLGQADNLPKTNVFPDVPMAYWGNACIGKAAELKIVNGYPSGKFGPDDPVTYEQAVTMIVRAIGAEDEANSNGGYPNGYWYVANQKNLLKGVTYLWGQGMPRNAVAVLVYNYYTAAPEVGHTHDWATRHVDEVGHYEESSGTHRVIFKRCDCGFEVNSDTPNVNEVWTAHTISCRKTFIYWYEDVPNDSQYVVDTPAHDEIYCTVCGATK